MATYSYRCTICDNEQDLNLPMSAFGREKTLSCTICGGETPHRHVPAAPNFVCKGPGFPTYNERLKRDRKRTSSKKTQVMVDRTRSGEGVSSVKDLGKPMK